MTEPENHFTVFIRLPFKRGEFVDPPPVAWSAAKERDLWDIISRQSKGNEINWTNLAEQFQVSQQFLLQQAAWLYERQLSQVRAQMRRMGSRQSATASPAPSSAAASMIGTQTHKRPAALASRGPSRLSTQIPTSTSPADTSVPTTPARSRTSLPLKPTSSTAGTANTRVYPTSSRPLSRKSSRDYEPSSRTHSRRGSIQYHASKASGDLRSADLTSSSDDEPATKSSHRRPNPASTQRRTSNVRKSQHTKASALSVHQLQEQREEDEDEDDSPFLPFAHSSTKGESLTATNASDPSATLRGNLSQAPTPAPIPASTSNRPSLQRNHTSERIKPSPSTATLTSPTTTTTTTTKQREIQPPLTSSTSSLSSSNSPYHHPQNPPSHRQSSAPATTGPQRTPSLTQNPNLNLPTPLSPRQQAALAAAAGLSPRHRSLNNRPSTSRQGTGQQGHGYTGSESSPSMGSSFSDLDDASVTQSALEEALMSNMNTMGSTAGIGVGAIGSRVSGISQALRSRYFDARAGTAGGGGGGGNGGNPSVSER